MENNHTFLYFAYGSNLLKERLQLKNPSAIVHCVARLKVKSTMQLWQYAVSLIMFNSILYTNLTLQDYKLVFGNHKGLASDRWHGGVATIEHSLGDEVWGVVWKMNISDLESLDEYFFVLVFLNSFPWLHLFLYSLKLTTVYCSCVLFHARVRTTHQVKRMLCWVHIVLWSWAWRQKARRSTVAPT